MMMTEEKFFFPMIFNDEYFIPFITLSNDQLLTKVGGFVLNFPVFSVIAHFFSS